MAARVLLVVLFLQHCFLFSQETLFIGIAGGTGSGKTTLAHKLHELFPEAVLISEDFYYKDLSHLPMDQRKVNNFDHPNAIEFSALQAQLLALKNGEAIEAPCYDFCTHTRTGETRSIQPANIVIVEGILLFTQPQLLPLFDIKIFVDTDSDTRVLRRIERDMQERNRELPDIRHQYTTTVKPMHDTFVEPSKKFADIIILEGGHNEVALSLISARLRLTQEEASRS